MTAAERERERAHHFVDRLAPLHLLRYSAPLRTLLHRHIDDRFDRDATLTAQVVLEEFVELACEVLDSPQPPEGARS